MINFAPSIYCLTATCGRHTCLERLVRFFLDQNYIGEHTLLIFNNSEYTQVLNLTEDLPLNKHIKLVNNDTSYTSKSPYQNLGEIYTDMLKLVPDDVDLVCFWDDDDIFLPDHLAFGALGYLKAKYIATKCEAPQYKAYKPKYSLYRHATGIDKVENVLEPSIFLETKFLKEHGFHLTTSNQHHKWLSALGNELFVDETGFPTLVYNWGDTNIPTFKTSGNPDNPSNFANYRAFSQDHGDGIVTPIKKEHSAKYYEQIKFFVYGGTNSNK